MSLRMRIAALYFLGFFSQFGLALQAESHYLDKEIQSPEPILVDDEYQAIYPPTAEIVHVPINCQNVLIAKIFPCRADSDLELRLEKEYWRHVATMDSKAMKAWLDKTSRYPSLSQTRNSGRLAMLKIFAYLHIYADSPLIVDPIKSPHVLAAFAAALDARAQMPRSPNAQAFYWAMENFTLFTVGAKKRGVEAAEQMIALGEIYGEWGAAGPIGAVAHLMGANDPELVTWGINYYDQCFEDGVCQRATSIAPFQYIGTLITQAEAYAFLGDERSMHRILDEVSHLGVEQGWPFIDHVEDIRHELTKSGGLMELWRSGLSVGALRAPRGVSHKREACAYCHAGNFVPRHYYP